MFTLPRNVWLLTLILALAMSAGAMMVLIGGVLGAQLASNASLSTMPVALMIVGTAVGVVPVTRTMGKVGRKPVFVGVALLACASALLASLSVYWMNFPLFLGASFILGIAVSGFQQIRFAAMESVDFERAPKAASTVLLGGLAAAVLGPEMVTLGSNFTSTPFVGSFLLMAMLCGMCAILFSFMQETHIRPTIPINHKVDISSVLSNPMFIIAVSASVVGYALMSFIMTATPVHMHVNEYHSLEQAKWVIQSHILAMYLPSLFSGWLISKLGVFRVIALGLVIFMITIMVASQGNHLANYWVALILLGIGWNFLFLGGTVLLPQTHNEQQKFRVQSINEFAVFSAQGVAALGAGAMLFQFGWKGLMLISVSIIVAHAVLLIWQTYRRKHVNHQHTKVESNQ
ncbi:MFS transporter [Aliiglaciecola litoralis]|uniref:MFS transporter n=1 Tax=Aliiglaciecola litoralis TaxID=582857 RepID=A0ABN1LDY3_9ALTE